jgi:hypothetical protein
VGLIITAAFPKAPSAALLAVTEAPDLLFFAFQAAEVERQAVTQMDFSKGLTYISPAHMP